MKIVQHASYQGDDWWDWSVELEADGPTLDRVKYVEYELHPTFPKPVRRSTNRSTNFRLATAGWGGFTIYAEVVFRDGSKEKLQHELELLYPDGTRTNR
jgi:transcription initiation factor IIF auxiliary subunit